MVLLGLVLLRLVKFWQLRNVAEGLGSVWSVKFRQLALGAFWRGMFSQVRVRFGS